MLYLCIVEGKMYVCILKIFMYLLCYVCTCGTYDLKLKLIGGGLIIGEKYFFH